MAEPNADRWEQIDHSYGLLPLAPRDDADGRAETVVVEHYVDRRDCRQVDEEATRRHIADAIHDG